MVIQNLLPKQDQDPLFQEEEQGIKMRCCGQAGCATDHFQGGFFLLDLQGGAHYAPGEPG